MLFVLSLGGHLICDLIQGLTTGEKSVKLKRWWNFDRRKNVMTGKLSMDSASQSLVYAKQHLCVCADGADVVINHAEMPASCLGFGESLPPLGMGVWDSIFKRNKHERQVWKDFEICDYLAGKHCLLFLK